MSKPAYVSGFVAYKSIVNVGAVHWPPQNWLCNVHLSEHRRTLVKRVLRVEDIQGRRVVTFNVLENYQRRQKLQEGSIRA